MTTQQAVGGVVRTYRGRPGCGCGCRGTYSDGMPKLTRRRVRDAAAAVAAGEKYTLTLTGETEDGAVCLALENEARYLWIYFDSRVAADAFVAAAAA